MKKVLASLVVGSALLSGCSTILTDDVQKINVNTTNGQTAQVSIDGNSFEAPGVITVNKDGQKSKILSSSTPGCVKEVALSREVEPTFFVNILSGGAFGSTTDYSTDKMWKYQDDVTVTCKN